MIHGVINVCICICIYCDIKVERKGQANLLGPIPTLAGYWICGIGSPICTVTCSPIRLYLTLEYLLYLKVVSSLLIVFRQCKTRTETGVFAVFSCGDYKQ